MGEANLKNKRLLAIFAHPDDESFCCGGSLRKVADAGVTVHLLCATRGEDGQWHGNPIDHKDVEKEEKLAGVRVKELEKAAKILGIESVEYLDFIDGLLNNRDLSRLTRKIAGRIERFRPQAVLTFDRGGISGHIDHIVISAATTAAVKECNDVERLYCCTASSDLIKKIRRERPEFPDFLAEKDLIVVKYDISNTWETKKKAVVSHKTQRADWQRLIPIWEELPKFEYYKLAIERQPEKLDGVPFF